MLRQLGKVLAAGSLIVVTTACSDPSNGEPSVTGPSFSAHSMSAPITVLGAVLAGNEQSVLAAPALVPPGAPLAPFVEARLYAIANVAMHDALNAIHPVYARYADNGPIVPTAHRAAAVYTAAHNAIVGAAPGAAGAVDAWYAPIIASLSNAPGFADGVAIGSRAASAILALRSADGTAGGGVAPYTPGHQPGDYVFTFPFNTPGFDFFGTGGFADASQWAASVTPFVVTSASQFRAPPPYGAASNADAVRTIAYADDYREVQRVGCDVCIARSPVRTEIAKFWVENSPTGWNRIARTVVQQQSLSAHDAARLLALVQMGEFDAYTTSLESKYHYNFWRPVSAIEAGDTDGNPRTSASVGWQVVVFPTPPVPDYPSAHATAGGAAAAIMDALVVGRVRTFSTTSTSLPGAVRRYNSLGDAARENADSRVFVGYHFRHATDVGLSQGIDVGRYVAGNALQRLN